MNNKHLKQTNNDVINIHRLLNHEDRVEMI